MPKGGPLESEIADAETIGLSGSVRTGRSGESSELFEVGELVGGAYEIRSVLGEGGMGRVFEAFDLALHRRVAIKASLHDVDPSLLRKEAQALAAVKHPGTTTVHALGVHRGVPYLVMEHLFGVNLATAMAARRLGGEGSQIAIVEALEILIQVAEALAAVHRADMAHRDVKPGNIMLTPGGRVVLTDFGLFHSENVRSASVIGTPGYMAPEAITGAMETRSAFLVDVYAFGVTAFELLTGQLPFTGTDAFDLLEQHLHVAAPSLRRTRADVPAKLDALIAETLAKEPLTRPASMESIVWRLRDVLAAQARPAATKRFGVLVVDDDEAIARLIRTQVSRAMPDAVVTVVNDAERALVAVRKHAPHVMLLDLHMPRMNGVELCMYLRGTHIADNCMIVAVSAGAQEADLELLRALGIARFVPKGSELGARLLPHLREAHAAYIRAAESEDDAPEAPGT